MPPFHSRLVLVALLLGLAGCAESSPDGAASTTAAANRDRADALTLAVIPKGTTHVFWKSVEAGARQAGTDLGVNIIWKGPLTENDRAQQIQLVEDFIAQGVDGIVLAPLDSRALVRPVRQARGRDIPVVIFDSALEGTPGADFVSFVATDNRRGGELAGEALADLLASAGDVVLLRYLVGSASTNEREEGFLEAIRARGSMSVLSDNRYAGATAGEAKTQALNMIDEIRAAAGVFCPNESSTYGMLLALRQENLAGSVRFVGFDASPPLVEALEQGHLDALVVQNPHRMGYEAVAALVAHLRGEPVAPSIDTGVAVVTRENLHDPDIQQLLK